MDEIVKAALKKWPHVPHCHRWLALDARGDWYMRDERVQRAGPFPAVKGSRITHEKLREFIHRNYGADEHGAWFFQNGPQRVYVDLEAAPYVWRVSAEPGHALVAHTGTPAGTLRQAWLDENGRLFADTALGFGLVHTLDMALAAQAVEQALAEAPAETPTGAWAPVEMPFAEMPARFGYCLQPRA
jgi:Protein of unknown function (DUF2946)